MTADFLDTLFLGALTYLAHSTVFLGLALITTSLGFFKNHALKEMVLRLALFAGLVTAPVHLSGAFQPIFTPINLPQETLKSEPVPLQIKNASGNRPVLQEPEPTATQSTPRSENFTPAQEIKSLAAGKEGLPLETARQAEPKGGISLNYTNLTLLAWLFLGAAFLGQLGFLAISLKTQLTGRKRLTRGRAVTLAQTLAEKAGIRPPALSTKTDLAGPFCLARGEIVLPDWAGDLPRHQLKALLAHEIAHLKRNDPAWLLVARVLQSVFFFQPLNFIAAKRLQEISEFSCDAWASKVCGSGMPLAECLAECAKRHLGRAPAALGAAMATKRSPIVERTQRLLNNVAEYTKTPSPYAKGGVLGVFVLTAALFPVFGFEPLHREASADEDKTTAHVVIDGERFEVEKGKSYAIDKDGTVTVVEGGEGYSVVETDDSDDQASVSFSTSFDVADGDGFTGEIHGTAHFSSSSHIIENDDGFMDVKITYKDKNQTLKIRGEGKFGFNDAETAMEFMANDSYLDITETRNDTTRRVRFEGDGGNITEKFWLNGEETPKNAALERWLAEIIPAVYRQTGIDAQGRTKRIFKRSGVDGVLDEMALIPGNYTKREYASTLAGLTQFNDDESRRFMEVVGGISGSYDLRETLTAYTGHQTLSEAEWGYFAQAAKNISGSYDLRETLSATAHHFKGPDKNWRFLLDAAEGISSSYDLRETLTVFKDTMPRDGETIRHLTRVMGGISSSYDLRETLSAYARERGFDEDAWMAFLDAAQGISSSYDLRSTLETFADHMPRSERVMTRYRDVANGISGNYDREQALEALSN